MYVLDLLVAERKGLFMLNEAELIERENIIRSLRIDKEVLDTKRAIARWLALSLGIINPGESRQSAVAVLDALVYFQFIKHIDPSVSELSQYISSNWEAMNEKTLRYHLLRMKKMGLIENSQSKFYFKPPKQGDRYDPYAWFVGVFESTYKEVGEKVAQVINELKNKSSVAGV